MDQYETTLLLVLVSICWTGGQCDVVQVPIGLESGAITTSSITASSQWHEEQGPGRGRLNMDVVEKHGGCWVAHEADINQWIQVDLLTPFRITGVATQGRSGEPEWVTSFKIACSTDNDIFDTVKDAVNPEADKIFPANSDRNTVVFNPLPVAILCRYVRLIPVTWHTFIALRMELYMEEAVTGTDVEQIPIGLEGGAFNIPDSSFTASSQKNKLFNPWRGRLNMVSEKRLSGGWVAKKASINQWIQVDLLTPYRITGVATQGRSDYSQWVTSFKIASSVNVIFDTVKDPANTNADKIFPANSDRNTVVFNPLPVAILCRYVRLIPVTWHKFIALRMELYREGTVIDPIQDASPLGLESGAIPDSSWTASGWDANKGLSRRRLNIAGVGTLSGGWSAETNDLNQWIQVDLLATYNIVGVATQGRQNLSQWVTSFKIACSMNSVTFDTVKDPVNTNADNIFPGNRDHNNVVYNRFPVPMLCRYVRLLPYTWHQHISLRMELFGELLASTEASTTMDTTMEDLQSTTGETTVYLETTHSDQGMTSTASTTLETSSEGTVAMNTSTRRPPQFQDNLSSTEASTTMDTTMEDLQSTAGETVYIETTQSDQGTTSTASTTLKTSRERTVAMNAPTTKTTPPQLHSKPRLLLVLADLNETKTVTLGILIPMILYFTFLMLALLLRCIVHRIRGLNKKEVEPEQKRPQRMYELVRIP